MYPAAVLANNVCKMKVNIWRPFVELFLTAGIIYISNVRAPLFVLYYAPTLERKSLYNAKKQESALSHVTRFLMNSARFLKYSTKGANYAN